MTGDVATAEAFFADAVARGHEGVVVKSLDAPYAAGRRGSEWIKVKPRHTLDLVVLAAEWGHGRRRGWLSNLHLGARDPATGGLVMLGKTFKGLTDQMLALADRPGCWTSPIRPRRSPRATGAPRTACVRVRPELVVEIAFDGVQASPRYPGGLALRFARVLRYRPDKDGRRGRHHRRRPCLVDGRGRQRSRRIAAQPPEHRGDVSRFVVEAGQQGRGEDP